MKMNNKGQAGMIVLICVGALAAAMILGFVMTGYDFASFKFWAPKYENAKRQVFENTQSYVQGKTEYLGRLRFQYQEAEGSQKDALRTLILSEASTVDSSKLPYDLQAFIRGIQ
jgi:hypothetical protein